MHFHVFCQKLAMFGLEQAQVALVERIYNHPMSRTLVSIKLAVLGKPLVALVTVDPYTLVHREFVLFNIACFPGLIITFGTKMHWLLFVAQGMVPQVFFAVGLVIALVAEHLVMSCLVLPDSFCVLCKWNFVGAYVALEVPEINV